MTNNYLKFISSLSANYYKWFGKIWWYSLLHEKNTTKSNTIHVLLKNLKPKKVSIFKIILNGIRKYFVFVGRYFIFKFKSKKYNYRCKNLFVSYNGDFFNCLYDMSDSEVIIIPQKFDWKEVFKRDNLAVDQFISFIDLITVPFESLFYFTLFILKYFNMKSIFNILGKVYLKRDDAWDIFKEEVWKSFAGEVLIEGLFFQKIFYGIFLKFTNVEKVIYVYEGQAWEKALCIAFKDKKKVGVLCTIPSKNMTQFWYDKDEKKLMPLADALCTISDINNILKHGSMASIDYFNLGSTRHGYLKNMVRKSKSDRVVVALGYNDEQNKELLEWVYNSDYKNVYVREHPSRRLIQDYFPYDFEPNLDCKILIVASDSMITFEAFAMNIKIVIPELKSFANLNSIPYQFVVNSGNMEYKETRMIELKDYFTFRQSEEMIKILEDI